MRRLPIPLFLILLLAAGCGMGAREKAARPAGDGHEDQRAQDPKEAGQPKEGVAKAGDVLPRKIKYTADIRMITEDFAKTEAGVKEQVVKHQGYVANSEISGAAGAARQGFWRVRIPVKNFDAFREEVYQLGEVEKNSSDSQDMTEEYYDLEGHIKVKTKQLEGLTLLMQKAADKDNMANFKVLNDQVFAVQAEIDRLKGRLQLVANLTELTTVSISARERQKYVKDKGPGAAETPTFGMRVSATFQDSLGALKATGADLAIFFVALAPWLPLVVVIIVPAWIFVRRRLHAAAPVLVEATPIESPTKADQA